MIDLKNKKILITGGTGFLGVNLARFLIEERRVIPKDIRIFYLEGSSTIALADLPEMDLFPGNVLNFDVVREACRGVDLVFHTAGNTSFQPRNRKIQWLVNVEGTRNVIHIAQKSNSIQRVCYTSTVNTLGCPDPIGSIGTIETSNPYLNKPKLHVFNSPEEALEFADAVHNNTAPKKWWNKIGIGYFDSKLAAQELVSRAVKEHGLNIVSILPGTLFGARDVFIGNGIYLIRVYNNKMPGAIKGSGLPLVHVMDAVRGHILAMEKGKKGERYIITGHEKDNMYLIDMLKAMAKVLQEKEPEKKIKSKFVQISPTIATIGATIGEFFLKLFNKPSMVSRKNVKAASYPSFYSYEKAKNELGYEPQKSFREAVEEMYDDYKKRDYFSKKEREVDKTR